MLSGSLQHGAGTKLSGGLSSLSGGSTLLSQKTSSLVPSSALLSSCKIETVSPGLTQGLRSEMLGGVHAQTGLEGSGLKGKKKIPGKKGDKKSRKRARIEKDFAPPPDYYISKVVDDKPEMEIPKFTPPNLDRSLLAAAKVHDVNGLKVSLVNLPFWICTGTNFSVMSTVLGRSDF